MSPTEMTEAELHAFIDGELEDGRAQIVAGLIEADPILRQRVAAYRADHEQLRTIYQPLIEEPLPARLVRAVTAGPAARRPIGLWAAGATLAAAAAIALVLWSGALDRPPQDGLLAEALAVRDGAVTAEQQLADVPAGDGDALVAKTLSPSVKIPDLGQEGYKLAGLAVYPDHAQGKAVQLNYRNAQGRRLTVYLHRPTGTDRYEILPEKQGRRVCIWENQELSAVMVGDGMSEQEMLRTAQRAYHPLNF
jgi:anti-sigma factor RsiW